MDNEKHSLSDLVDWLVSLALAGSLPPGISHVLHVALTLVGGFVTSFGANLASISDASYRLPLLFERNVFERCAPSGPLAHTPGFGEVLSLPSARAALARERLALPCRGGALATPPHRGRCSCRHACALRV